MKLLLILLLLATPALAKFNSKDTSHYGDKTAAFTQAYSDKLKSPNCEKMTILYGQDTPSMHPFIDGENWLLVENVPLKECKRGDVILYLSDATRGEMIKKYVAHQIVRGNHRAGFLVKGTNELTNPEEDNLRVTAKNYAGKVVHVYLWK